MAENIINKNLSGFTKEMLDMTYPDEYYKNTIQPAKAGTGPVPSKMQMFSKFQPGKAMMIGMDPYLPGFMQQGYDKFRAAPTQAVKNIAGTLGKGITSLASLPAQAAFFTLGSTPANADEANMGPEDFRALAEAQNTISPTTNRNFDRDFSMFDQARMGQARMGDAVSGTNVQGMDYEMDPGAFTNPNIQPSQNMFQRAGNAIQGGIGSLQDVAGKGINLGKMAMSGIGNAIMPGLGFIGSLLSGFDKFDTLSLEDQAFILDQAGGNRPAKDPFGKNIRSARGNYADYVRTKGIYAKGKRGDYYRSIVDFNPQQIATLQRERKAKRAYEKQIKDAADAASRNAARARSITAGYGGSDDSRGATGPTAAGAGMGVGGGYASDYGFKKDGGMIGYRDGGLASMFVRRR